MRAANELLTRVQFVPRLLLRQANAPPYHSRFELLGSIANGWMNRKLPAASVTPLLICAQLAPPFSDRCRLLPVFSAYSTFVSTRSTATYPPSPPRISSQFCPPASLPRSVPLSCVPPKNVWPSG